MKSEKGIFEFLGLVYKVPTDRKDGTKVVKVEEVTDVTDTTNVKKSTEKKAPVKKPKSSKKPKKLTLKKPKKTEIKTHIIEFTKVGIDYLHTLTETRLSHMLREANDAYYNKEALMSDGQYDILKEYIEEKYPENKVLDEVGAPIVKEKGALPYYMGSMDRLNLILVSLHDGKRNILVPMYYQQNWMVLVDCIMQKARYQNYIHVVMVFKVKTLVI